MLQILNYVRIMVRSVRKPMLKKAALIIFTLAFFILSGCQTNQQRINGDIIETTEGIRVIPTFLTRSDKDTRDTYKKVYEYKDILKQIPTYENGPYQNVFETYFYKENADGTLEWNNHALNSGNLLAIGRDATALAKSGTPLAEIQKQIEKKYSGEYGADDPRRNFK